MEGKIFENLPFINILEINFWKLSKIFDFSKKTTNEHVKKVAAYLRTYLAVIEPLGIVIASGWQAF